MDLFRSAGAITYTNFMRWKSDLKVWLIFGFLTIHLVQELKGLTEFGLEYGEQCTAYLLPMLFDSPHISVGTMKMMLYLGGILLLCDAPFIYQNTPYMVVRSRRESWWMGECLYILCTTFLYTSFIVLISTLVILPVATFGESWGGVVSAFAFGRESIAPITFNRQYDVYIGMPTSAVNYLYPAGCQVYLFFTVWASLFWLGLLQYLISLKSKNIFLGFAVASVFVFLDPILNCLTIMGDVFRWVQVLSPVCWTSVVSLQIVEINSPLTIPFVVGMLAFLILATLFAIRMISKKIIIEVRGEV